MKLSELKGKDAVKVIARLMRPIARIAINNRNREDDQAEQDKENGKKKPKKPIPQFLAEVMENNPDDMLKIISILLEKPAEEITGVDVYIQAGDMVMDEDLMLLFGYWSETEATSGSASETTEGQETA